MKGYWHIVALSVAFSILHIYFQGILFLISLMIWLAILYKYKRLGKLPLFVSLIFLLFFIFYLPSSKDTDTNIPAGHMNFMGQVTGQINITDLKIDFRFLDQHSNDTLLAIYFFDKKEKVDSHIYKTIKHGATCAIHGQVELPNRSRNPGQFDYRKYLASQGITYQLKIRSLDDISCNGSSFLNRIYRMRTQTQAVVHEKYSEETEAWINALVLGNDTHLKEDTIELFQRWGLSHLLAISGLHVGLIVALVYFLLIKLAIVTKEKAQWIMILFLPIYAIIAGGEPSVWRASIMVLLCIILSKTRLQYSVTDIVSVVFILLILFDKFIVYHVGFQLSFIVTFGLILSRKWISQSDSLFFQMLKISFISQMMILPLQFAYFYTLQPLSILLNVIVVPYFSLFVIPLMFLLLLLSPLPIIPKIIDSIFIQVHQFFQLFIEYIDKVLYYPWVIGSFPVIMVVVYYGTLLVMMMYIERNQLVSAFKFGCYLTITITFVVIHPYLSPYGTVTMLDIGQGDAFIIELPYRRGVFFIDAGSGFAFEDMQPTEKVYKQILKPYLYSKGILTIDAIFVSHEDIDHMGSVDFLIKGMNVKKVFISSFYKLQEDTAHLWNDHGVIIERIQQHDAVNIAGQAFDILSPSRDNKDNNENSLVIHANIGGESWLFTGDIGKDTEKEILKTHGELSVDILKVGHHGSKTSTDQAFIKQIKPAIALISVGEMNTYGHPTSEVLETLAAEDVSVLRTDKDGAVIFRFKNQKGTFYKYLP